MAYVAKGDIEPMARKIRKRQCPSTTGNYTLAELNAKAAEVTTTVHSASAHLRPEAGSTHLASSKFLATRADRR